MAVTKTFTVDSILTDAEQGISVFINGVDYSRNAVNFNFKEVNNELSIFEAEIIGVDSSARGADVLQDKEIKFLSRGVLLFKGILERPDYETGESVNIKGYGSGESLLKRQIADNTAASLATSGINRPIYENTAVSTIISEQIATVGTVTVDGTDDGSALGSGTFRGEHISVLEMVANPVMNKGGDWWFSYGSAPTYNTNVFHADDERGTGSSVKTFTISGVNQNINLTKNEQDFENLWNYVEVLGYGDGINQKRSLNFHATDNRSILDGSINATDTTISLVDASDFPASGDVWIGMEKVTYSGKSTNDLTGCIRGVSGGYDAYAHTDGIEVYDEQYTTASPESGSSIDTYGLKQHTVQDKTVIDQDTLDRIAQQVLSEHRSLVTRIELYSSNPYDILRNIQVGDTVTITDADTDLSGDYIVNTKIGKSDTGFEQCVLGCSTKRLSLTEELGISSNLSDVESKFMQGSTNIFVVNETDNAETPSDLSIDDFEDNWTNWDKVGGTDAITAVQNTSIEQEGSSCIELGIDASASGVDGAQWTNITDSSDISDYTGVASGAPVRGRLKFWIRFSTTDYLFGSDAFTLRLGSSSIDRASYIIDTAELVSNADGAWYAYSVNLADYDSLNGTPDWTAMDWVQISVLELVSNTDDFTLYLDDLRLDGVESSSVGPIEVFFEIPAEAVAINQLKLAYRNEAPRIWVAGNNSEITGVQSAGGYLNSTGSVSTTVNFTTIDTLSSVNSDCSGMYVFLSQILRASGGSHSQALIRLYDGTNYYPSSDGLVISAPVGGEYGEMLIHIPINTNGKTITIEARWQPTQTANIQMNWGWWTESEHNHVYNISANDSDTGTTYTTSDIRIFTSDNASGAPSYTERTTAIETALGGALTATVNGSETDIDLTSFFSSTGWKAVKFVTNGNSRHKIQVLSKVFIQAKET